MIYFWETSVLGTDVKKDADDKTYVVYKLVVQDESQSWTIERRYNDFYSLHAKLKERFSESQLPSVPPKGFQIFTNTDPAFLKERSSALEKYLRLLLKKDAPTCQCGEVLDFLDPNKKSSLNSSLPIPPPPKNTISLLPKPPPRLFILNQESIFLPDGEECFLPQFFDYIDESIKYLVQVDGRISSSLSAQSKMNIFEVEKERILSTLNTLTDQQKVANQIIQAVLKPKNTNSNSNSYSNNTNYNNYNDYSNIYNNNYTNNNYNNNYNHNPYGNYQNQNQHRPPSAYSPYGAPSNTYGYSQPQQNNYYVVVSGNTASAPPANGLHSPPVSEGATILANYLESILTCIQEIWESGLEESILVECVNSSGWCEILERLKWFDGECEKLIVGSLGVTLPKDQKKALKKKIKQLREQATKYLDQITENPKHKCGLPPSTEVEHSLDVKQKMKKTLDFINENKKRISGSSAEEIVAGYEGKMFKVLEDIANLENRKYLTSEERKEYKDKSAEIRKKITSIMKHASEFRGELTAEMTKLQSHEGDKSTLPDEGSLYALLNRLEDLQANLADLSHDFSKALEIAQRGGLGSLVTEKQLEDARKTHEQNADDMFEL